MRRLRAAALILLFVPGVFAAEHAVGTRELRWQTAPHWPWGPADDRPSEPWPDGMYKGVFSEGLAFRCRKRADQCGYVDKSERLVIPQIYSIPGDFSEGLADVEIGGSFGYIDRTGKVKIEARFSGASEFSDGVAAVSVENLSGYIGKDGQFVIPPKFTHVESFWEGHATVRIKDSVYSIDHAGTMRPTQWVVNCRHMSGGLGACQTKNFANNSNNFKWGFVDRTGRFVIQPGFNEVKAFSEGLAPAKADLESYWGYIDARGTFVIAPNLVTADPFNDGAAAASRPLKVGDRIYGCGYLDVKGAWLGQREPCEHFFEGRAVRWVPPEIRPAPLVSGPIADDPNFRHVTDAAAAMEVIDERARRVGGLTFENADFYSQGLAAVKHEGAWGYVDREGKVAIKPQFQYAGRFNEGLASVRQGKLYGWIDRAGRWVIPPRFAEGRRFSNGLAAAREELGRAASLEEQRWGYIDRKGRWVIAPRFETARDFSEGVAFVGGHGRWGLVDKMGKVTPIIADPPLH